jgi:hypothetical protein
VPSSGLPQAVEQLRAGNAGPLRHWLDGSAPAPLHEWQDAWYRTFTIVGGLREQPRTRQGDRIEAWLLFHQSMIVTGGAPRVVDDVVALRADMRAALADGPTRTSHRARFLAWIDAVLDGRVERTLARNVIGLARHYTDLPVDEMSGWIEPMHGEVTAANRPLLEWLRELLVDDRRHRVLLDEGLASPSRPRRELSEALLRLTP